MAEHYKFRNRPLPYDYDALEPYIDGKTMRLHHDKHLQGYINNLNGVLEDYPKLQEMSLEQLLEIAPRLPRAIGTPVSRYAGGVYNHRFYFDEISPDAMRSPYGVLAEALYRDFGDFRNFENQFSEAALSVFGSGYAWLVADRRGALGIVITQNQGTPVEMGLCPVINIDVWEHAYYLKHYNERAEYVKDWFHVLNWEKAEENYFACIDMRHQ